MALVGRKENRRQWIGRRKRGKGGEGRNKTEPKWNRIEKNRTEMG